MKRVLIIAAAVVGVLLVIGGLFVWRLSRQVNLTSLLSEGGAASVATPPGFDTTIFMEGLDGPRFITFDEEGVLYVAERGANRIVTIADVDRDGVGDGVRVFAGDLNRPHSVVYDDGVLYVGETSRIVRLVDSDGDGQADQHTVVIDGLPTSGFHSTRTVEILPDGRLVVSIGSSCNVCDEEDWRRAAIVVYDNDGANGRLYARGLRNAVGLAIEPTSGALWAANNGRDLMGDDLPPEMVVEVREGQDYGWPVCHNGDIIDPDLGYDGACTGVAVPEIELQAHTAPLGLVFYDGEAFGTEYQGDLFIAQHGSWNRSEPVGYQVVRVDFENGRPVAPAQIFADGWLQADGDVLGRPVGIAVGPEGALYVSDDKSGFIYRIAPAD